MNPARRMAGAVVLVATGIVLVSSLGGCKATVAAAPAAPAAPGTAGSAASVAVQSGTPAPAVVGKAAVATAADAPSSVSPSASSTAASGSLSVSISSPVTVSGSVRAPVSCVAGGLSYRASVAGAAINGDEVTFSVAIARYRGPGSYPAVVAATLLQLSGTLTAIGGISRIPAVIAATGGSFTVSAVGTGGRTFAGTLSWECA